MAELDIDIRLERNGRSWSQTLRTDATRIGVQGPSGAGKTTLLRIVAGLEPAVGRVVVRGRVLLDGRRSVPPWERRIGWMPQEALLFPHADVLGNLRWSGATASEAGVVADGLGLGHLLSRRPRHLSGGERQRVALGRALLASPDVLLLDEPFTALDRELRVQVQEFLCARMEDTLLLLVAHDLADGVPVDEIWDARSGGGLARRASND